MSQSVCARARVCVCLRPRGETAGAITRVAVVNTRAAKHNKRRSAGITGLPVSHASLCQAGIVSHLLEPPVSSCIADRRYLSRHVEHKCADLQNDRTHQFVVSPSSVKVHRAVSAMLKHRPAATSGLHVTKYLWIEMQTIPYLGNN